MNLTVPSSNIEIYTHLFVIETALRELIISTLQSIEGPLWYKKRIPGDVLAKCKEGILYERKIKWSELIPHHPIYYVDFAHLKQIIVRNDNWRDGFAIIFERKDILDATLSEIEFIRNKIAHNRKATHQDLDITKGAYIKLSECIGPERFKKLSLKCTAATDIRERLLLLRDESSRLFKACANFEEVQEPEIWTNLCNEWWFDEYYLMNTVDSIRAFYDCILMYCKFERKRGEGYKIESWVKSKNIDTLYKNSEKEFSIILD